jgi:hypothetical protein
METLAPGLRAMIAGRGDLYCTYVGAPLGQVVGQVENPADEFSMQLYAAAAFATLGEMARAMDHAEAALDTNPNHVLSQIAFRIRTDALQCMDPGRFHFRAKSISAMDWTNEEYYSFYQLINYKDQLRLYRRFPTYIEPLFVYVYAALLAVGQQGEFAELGGSLFDAWDKLRNCEKLFGLGLNLKRVSMINIERSSFLAEMARLMHLDIEIQTFKDWRDVPTSASSRVSFLRGVGSYAFGNCAEFAEWLLQSKVTLLREEFASGEIDEVGELSGMRYINFSLSRFLDTLSRAGLRVRPILSHPAINWDGSPRKNSSDSMIMAAYLVIEQLRDDERASLCRTLDSLDLTSCHGAMNGMQMKPLPISSAIFSKQCEYHDVAVNA